MSQLSYAIASVMKNWHNSQGHLAPAAPLGTAESDNPKFVFEKRKEALLGLSQVLTNAMQLCATRYC